MTIRLAVTLGDPRGIGPEVIRKALGDDRIASIVSGGGVEFVLVGPSGTELDVNVSVGSWSSRAPDAAQKLAGQLSGLAIERAVEMILAGKADALVTGPIDKAALLAGGFDYPGHTEMLGALTGCPTTMMLVSDRLRVVLATTHMALRDVPAAVTGAALVSAIEATRTGLREGFGIAEPRLALCALNPHAGDNGRFGDEDDRILRPAAIACGIAGPLPADTVFVRALSGEFDAVIAPYHDVGMTAIKVASFGSAVNVTLGLPFARTSPDHGTAMDIAGKGAASALSMIKAIEVALELSDRKRSSRV